MNKHTSYRFTKDGKTYSIMADNRFSAQLKLELQFQIDLTGATFEEVYKSRTVRTGIVK